MCGVGSVVQLKVQFPPPCAQLAALLVLNRLEELTGVLILILNQGWSQFSRSMQDVIQTKVCCSVFLLLLFSLFCLFGGCFVVAVVVAVVACNEWHLIPKEHIIQTQNQSPRLRQTFQATYLSYICIHFILALFMLLPNEFHYGNNKLALYSKKKTIKN